MKTSLTYNCFHSLVSSNRINWICFGFSLFSQGEKENACHGTTCEFVIKSWCINVAINFIWWNLVAFYKKLVDLRSFISKMVKFVLILIGFFVIRQMKKKKTRNKLQFSIIRFAIVRRIIIVALIFPKCTFQMHIHRASVPFIYFIKNLTTTTTKKILFPFDPFKYLFRFYSEFNEISSSFVYVYKQNKCFFLCFVRVNRNVCLSKCIQWNFETGTFKPFSINFDQVNLETQ